MDARLKEIIEIIVAYLDPVKIILFGSRVRGVSHDDADYDLAIVYDGVKSKREVTLGIYDQFEDFDFSMDLFVLTTDEISRYKHIPNTLAREVTEHGKVVYG